MEEQSLRNACASCTGTKAKELMLHVLHVQQPQWDHLMSSSHKSRDMHDRQCCHPCPFAAVWKLAAVRLFVWVTTQIPKISLNRTAKYHLQPLVCQIYLKNKSCFRTHALQAERQNDCILEKINKREVLFVLNHVLMPLLHDKRTQKYKIIW